MDLIIFYANGQTFKFGQVTNLKIDGDKVEFDYFGASTQTHRHANFSGVVGYSTENKLMADGVKALEKAKADEKADKKAKKLAYDALIAENKAATTVAKLASVVDNLLKELSK